MITFNFIGCTERGVFVALCREHDLVAQAETASALRAECALMMIAAYHGSALRGDIVTKEHKPPPIHVIEEFLDDPTSFEFSLSIGDKSLTDEQLGSGDESLIITHAPTMAGELLGLRRSATEHAELIRLADAYKTACAAVQVAWAALLGANLRYELGLKCPQRTAYHNAAQEATTCHRALVKHASGGVLEVGQ